jgi:hypothetical protein
MKTLVLLSRVSGEEMSSREDATEQIVNLLRDLDICIEKTHRLGLSDATMMLAVAKLEVQLLRHSISEDELRSFSAAFAESFSEGARLEAAVTRTSCAPSGRRELKSLRVKPRR